MKNLNLLYKCTIEEEEKQQILKEKSLASQNYYSSVVDQVHKKIYENENLI